MSGEWRRHLPTVVAVLGLVAAVVLVLVGRGILAEWPVYPDEAGFFLVARETFHGSGDGLYGDYWVDRPPTLIWLFGVAAAFDDVHVVRALATTLLVGLVCCAWLTGRRLGGARPAVAAALVAAAFVTSPLLGAEAANGEALAIPFVAAGVLCVVVAFDAHPGRPPGALVRRQLAWAFAAGLLGAVALTTKQNFADVFVLAVVLALAQVVWRHAPWRDTVARLAAGVAGAATWVVVVLAWVLSRGSSVAEFWEVAVTFRTQASEVLQASHTSGIEERRVLLERVVQDAWLAPFLAVLVVLLLLGRLGLSPILLACAALVAFEAWCVVAGGSWWTHYLLGLVPGVALAAAVAAAPRAVRDGAHPVASGVLHLLPQLVVAAAVAAFVWTQAVALDDVDETIAARGVDNAQSIGAAIADASEPGDTLTVMYGAADLQWASGLKSPYAHLWSLPVRVLDPRLDDLRTLLASADRPTFVVVTLGVDAFGLDPDGATAQVLDEHYAKVGDPCGQELWVRADVRREVGAIRC